MDHGVTTSFTKPFTINTPYASFRTLRFNKNGKPIIETQADNVGSASLQVCDPSTENINEVGIHGKARAFFVYSYMETQLLHDHSDGYIF